MWYDNIELVHDVPSYEESASRQLLRILLQLVVTGQVKIGERLPNIVSFSDRLGFGSSYSVKRAYNQLWKLGLIDHPLSGEYVNGYCPLFKDGWVCISHNPIDISVLPEKPLRPRRQKIPTISESQQVANLVDDVINKYHQLHQKLHDLGRKMDVRRADALVIDSLYRMYKDKSIDFVNRLTDEIGDIVNVIVAQSRAHDRS